MQLTKDGRRAFRPLCSNLSNANSRDLEDIDNKNRIQSLTWSGDTANWTFDKFVLAHKECHIIQNRLHGDYGYQNFDLRDKVTRFTQGIRSTEYTSVILQIHGNHDGSRTDFEKSHMLVSDFKQILENQKKRSHRISEVNGGLGRGGRGDGGGSGGRSGGGRGGRGDGGKGWCFTHKTTKGTKEQLQAVKDPDGGWTTHRIAEKKHDNLTKLQIHIDKKYYSHRELRALEPLERRTLEMNREGTASQHSAIPPTWVV